MELKIEMFAIKQISTGKFIPNPLGRGGRGGTHTEPVDPSPVSIPRLFHTEAAAKRALSYWLQGKISVSTYGTLEGYVDEHWHTEPQPHRDKEDMKVVPIQLVLP